MSFLSLRFNTRSYNSCGIEQGTILVGNIETPAEKLCFLWIQKAQSRTPEPLPVTAPLCVRPGTVSWFVKVSKLLSDSKTPASLPV